MPEDPRAIRTFIDEWRDLGDDFEARVEHGGTLGEIQAIKAMGTEKGVELTEEQAQWLHDLYRRRNRAMLRDDPREMT